MAPDGISLSRDKAIDAIISTNSPGAQPTLPSICQVIFLTDGLEHEGVPLIFSHRDAHALYTYASRGITDFHLLPTRLNKTDAH